MTEVTEWSNKDDKKPSASLLSFVKKYHKYTKKRSQVITRKLLNLG